jgi:ubiquinone/menaquinone biosynthesis C-methylase UbiE
MPSFSSSRISAMLQNFVSAKREEAGLYCEIAEKLPLLDTGRLLDVGTGSGLQLKAIHTTAPSLELFGLDISRAAIRVARKNLEGLEIDLKEGSIESTDYDDDFFDLVTCNSSASYWRNPGSCFNEIFRILKHGRCAVLFEPQSDFDMDEVVQILDKTHADKNCLRRFLGRNLHKYGLLWGHKLGLRVYSIDEWREIASNSQFDTSHSIERTTLQKLPIFAQITLNKP